MSTWAAKVRACVVLSIQSLDTERALTTVVPHTTAQRGTRFEVADAVSFLRDGAFDAQNLITIPHAKHIRRLGALSEDQMRIVENTVKQWLGLV